MIKAGFLSRIAALLLDIALFVPIYFAVVYALTRLRGGSVAQMWDRNPVFFSATVGGVLWLTCTSLEWLVATSPGKLLLRMRITRPDGAPAETGPLFLRWAIKHSIRIFGLIDAMTLSATVKHAIARSGLSMFYNQPLNSVLARYLGEASGLIVLGGFLLVLRPARQALHDVIAGTVVYRKLPNSAKNAFEPVITSPAPLRAEPVEDES